MIRAIHDALATLLKTDPTFIAGLQALGLGTRGQQVIPQVIRSNLPLAQLSSDKLPAWILEQGDIVEAPLAEDNGDSRPIGLGYQGFSADVLLALVWSQQGRDDAYNQRLALSDLLAGLMLRNPDIGGAADARLIKATPDRAANHPLQVWQATLQTVYVTTRSQ